jgi:hypothetical protein
MWGDILELDADAWRALCRLLDTPTPHHDPVERCGPAVGHREVERHGGTGRNLGIGLEEQAATR